MAAWGIPGQVLALVEVATGMGVGTGEVGNSYFFGLLVIDLPDAAEVVVAVRADGGIDPVVVGAAGVVVDDGLVVKIGEVHGAVDRRLEDPLDEGVKAVVQCVAGHQVDQGDVGATSVAASATPRDGLPCSISLPLGRYAAVILSK